ncbi:MAG TPA: LysR family transcriptional regulator [Steroidobacteraceae bacterium]|nr:LysR family transcriptional regulator [Steroidobacteraceae bacterium]
MDQSRMIADEMAVFAQVVEHNGFTAAARRLKVPKVRVSRAVAALERALGARLLERTTRRIALTTPGKAILAHCQRVALEVEAARAALQPVPAGAPLRVAIDQGFGRLLVAPLVPRFLERFPQVTLQLIQAEDVAAGAAFDVELRSDGRVAEGEVASSLGTPPMILCAAPNYLAGKALPQSPSELAQHALLWAGTAVSSAIPRLSKDGGTVALPGTPRLVTEDLTALHAAVAAGLGIGALPEFMCRNGLAMKRLVRLLSDWSVADPIELTAVSPAARAAEPAVRGFVDFLAANVVPALAGAPEAPEARTTSRKAAS